MNTARSRSALGPLKWSRINASLITMRSSAAVAQVGVQGPGLGRIAVDDLLERAILEERPDGAVHPARAGAELTLLGLQTIEFGQDLDWHGDDVLIELEQGLGIVNQYVGVQDVSSFSRSKVVPNPRNGNLGKNY
jgi:hypothetical protein